MPALIRSRKGKNTKGCFFRCSLKLCLYSVQHIGHHEIQYSTLVTYSGILCSQSRLLYKCKHTRERSPHFKMKKASYQGIYNIPTSEKYNL